MALGLSFVKAAASDSAAGNLISKSPILLGGPRERALCWWPLVGGGVARLAS